MSRLGLSLSFDSHVALTFTTIINLLLCGNCVNDEAVLIYDQASGHQTCSATTGATGFGRALSTVLVYRIRYIYWPVGACLGRRGGLMVSALVSRSSRPGSSPGREHCVLFLGKTLYSHSTSLHPGV